MNAPSRWALALTTAAATAAATGTALAQRGQADLLPDDKILSQSNPQQWTLTTTVNIRAYQAYNSRSMPATERFEFKRAAVVYPMIAGTASSETNTETATGSIDIDDRDAVAEPDAMLEGYPSGTTLARWDLTNIDAREMTLEVVLPVKAFRTEINEKLASEVDWPSGQWPEIAASSLEPQLYIDYGPDGAYDMRPIEELVNEWTGGNPRGAKPYLAAKWLLGRVVEHVQPSGPGFNNDRGGSIEGLDVQGAAATAVNKRGSAIDMALLLTAVYREAGIPARLVVGYDAGSDKEQQRFLKTSRANAPEIRAWVEFALFDEAAGTLTWIPADPHAMRKSSSRIRPNFMEREQKYFGNHDELDGVIPFAFQLHPPTTVRSYGSPAFWGWAVLDNPPNYSEQSISFRAARTAQRGEDRRNRR